MSTVKAKVEDYIKNDRTLLGGRNLYNQLPGKNLAFQNNIARQPNNEKTLSKLIYELCRLAGIQERLMKIWLQKPVSKAKEESPKTQESLEPADALLSFDPEKTSYKDGVKLLASLDNVTSKSRSKVDVFAALSEAKAEALKKK